MAEQFLEKDDLKSLSDEAFKLFVLFRQLSTEGPTYCDYALEKIERLKQGIPIILHERLQEYASELKDKVAPSVCTKEIGSRWISTKDKLPRIDQFIVAIRFPWPSFYWMGVYEGVPNEEEDMFSHWMPLPAPPGEKE